MMLALVRKNMRMYGYERAFARLSVLDEVACVEHGGLVDVEQHHGPCMHFWVPCICVLLLLSMLSSMMLALLHVT